MFKAGTFTMNTGTGLQTVTISGTSETPVAVLFQAAPNVTADATITATCKRMVGAASGPTERWAHVTSDIDASGSGDCQTRATASSCLLDIDNAGAVLWSADLDSFGPGQFVINITVAPASAFIINYIAVFGNNVEAHAGSFSMPTVGASVSVTDPGFAPDALIAVYGANAFDVAEQDFKFGMAFATDSAQCCHYFTGQDLVGTSRKQVTNDDSKFVYGMVSTSTAVDWDSTVALTATGFDVSISNNPGTALRVLYLALGGVQATINSSLSPTSATTVQIASAFEPEALMMFDTSNGAVDTTPTRQSYVASAGLASSSSALSVVSSVGVDGAGTEDTADASDDSRIVVLYTNTSGGTFLIANISSFDTNGVTINYTTASAPGRASFHLLLAEDTPPPAQVGQYITRPLGRGAA